MDAIQAYREAEVGTDNPVRLVVLLYDQLLRDLQRALDAIAQNDIPRRTRELDHAFLVVGQLQGTINLSGGGEVAQTLDHFYSVVRGNLLFAVSTGSAEVLEQQRKQILAVREAWLEVERQQLPPSATPPAPAEPHQNSQENPEWKA
jgi:flagellar protein FliS